jgi:hypothetical protein
VRRSEGRASRRITESFSEPLAQRNLRPALERHRLAYRADATRARHQSNFEYLFNSIKANGPNDVWAVGESFAPQNG